MGWIRPDRSQMPAPVVVRDFGSKEPLPAAVLERHEAVTVDRLLSLEAENLLNGLAPLRDRALENAAYNLEAARRSLTSRTNSVATSAGRHWGGEVGEHLHVDAVGIHGREPALVQIFQHLGRRAVGHAARRGRRTRRSQAEGCTEGRSSWWTGSRPGSPVSARSFASLSARPRPIWRPALWDT